MEILLKGILDKLLKVNQSSSTQPEIQPISHADVEALVEAKLKEHAAAQENTRNNSSSQYQSEVEEDYKLSPKQIEYALSLIDKMSIPITKVRGFERISF